MRPAIRLPRLAWTPLTAILLFALALRLTGIFWGLPSTDGWDNDGIAPRDFLVGTAETFWWSHFFTYPPVHLATLTVLTAPVWLFRAITAPELNVAAFIHVPTMTALSVIARIVTVAMALTIIATLAKIAEELAGEVAGWCTAATATLNASFVYYSQTTNLDVPYLFWGVFAILELVLLVARREPERMRRVLAFAVLATGTKDQAYALFLLTLPLTLSAWIALDPWARARARAIVGGTAKSLTVAVLLLLLIDGAFVNPLGFFHRMQFLLGPASQEHAFYPKTLLGRSMVLWDALREFPRYYPFIVAPLALLGVALAPLRAGGGVAEASPSRSQRIASLVPLFAIVSFSVAFNMTARRAEHRFVLPQSLCAAVYIGIALSRLFESRRRIGAWAAGAYSCVAVVPAIFNCLAIDMAMVRDPRYGVEAWLRSHVMPGDAVEIYGNNVYLPRIPDIARTSRIDRADRLPASRRSPLPNVVEVEDSFSNVELRKPRFLILPEPWYAHFFKMPKETAPGAVKDVHTISSFDLAESTDKDAVTFLDSLFHGRLHYRLAYVGKYEDGIFPKVDIHGSTDGEVRVFEREPEP